MSDFQRIVDFLAQLGIETRMLEHPPADTMADCAAIDAQLGSLTPKNLFLTTKNGKRFCLCLVRPEVHFHTADISKQAGFSRLSFATGEALEEKLHCRPGSASPLGLIFDEAREVTLLVDSALRRCAVLGFHPCDNTRTLALSGADFFEKYLPALGVTPVDVTIAEADLHLSQRD